MRTALILFALTLCVPLLRAQNGVQQAWVSHYASSRFNDDTAADIVLDPKDGAIYVTGYSRSLRTGLDYLTVKYDALGNQLWTARFNGSGNGDDIASVIARDSCANVYVSGKSWSGDHYDFTTIRYNDAGVEQWVVRHPSTSAAYYLGAAGLAVDRSGNVYVAGSSDSDYVVIKYNHEGLTQWFERYDGPAHSDDICRSLTLDSAGNAYVTGASWGPGTSFDYATIKYNADGVTQWVARYNGPGHGNDHAHALALDRAGNLYVAGGSEGAETAYDYAVIKYSSDGRQLWASRFNYFTTSFESATNVVVAPSGNVYVAGIFNLGNQRSFLVVKHKPNGVREWLKTEHDSPGEPNDIVVDADENVYVTGNGYGEYRTLKYNSAGSRLWTARYQGVGPSYFSSVAKALVLDKEGNVYVVGTSYGENTSSDYVTIKYHSAGAEQWVSRYNGPGSSKDEALALALDRSGNVYVTGKSLGDGPYFKYATVKYNSTGIEQWVSRHRGDGPPQDYTRNGTGALAVDRSGNVYVTGSTLREYHYLLTDYLTIKHDSTGTEQWVDHYNDGYPAFENQTVAITIDTLDYVYVTGLSYGTSLDYATIKYNTNGAREWVARYNGSENDGDVPSAIAVDQPAHGSNVYVTGWTGSYQESKHDYGTVKYNSSGMQQWIARYNGPGNSNDEAVAIVVDRQGNICVTGYSEGAGTSWDYATIKYNSAGIEQWVARYNVAGNFDDKAKALALDGFGNVYVTGSSKGLGTSSDYVTIKYDSAGTEQWVARYDGPAGAEDQAVAVAVDEAGSIYVAGSSLGVEASFDYATVKYNAVGVVQWVMRYNGQDNANDKVRALAVDGSGNVYVTGSSSGKDWSVYNTIKYIQTPVAVAEPAHETPSSFALAQNYPNPFNPSTTIRYAIAKPGHITLKIFNLTGQEVATLVNEIKSAGEHKVQWEAQDLPSGVYVYRLQVGDAAAGLEQGFVATKKLILLR